jgi:hypothetical protein
MNVKLVALSTISLASLSALLQPALAERGRTARFDFAPNIYRNEELRVPQEHYSSAPHLTRSAMEGKVPHGTSFLGVDPQLLARPIPAAVTSTQVAMRVPTVTVSSPFKSSFGAPAQAALPLAPQAKAAQAGKLPAQPASHASRHVNGVLLSHKRPLAQAARPALALAKPVESYGRNFGYVPGQYVPIKSSSGWSATRDVFGKLLSH